jgi:membrane AbrB-like protein
MRSRLVPAASAALALAVSAAGGLAAQRLGLPAPFLVGGVIAVAIAAVMGAPVAVPSPLRNAGFLIVGMSVGSAVARDSLAAIGQWPVTMAALMISLAAIVWVGGWLLGTGFGFDRNTALLASVPGHTSLVQAVALTGLGAPAPIAVVQSTRLMTLVIAVPLAIDVAVGGALGPIARGAEMDWPHLARLAALAVAAGWLADGLNMPAGFVIGAMLAATVARLGGLTEGTIPGWLTVPGFVIVAALIGTRFLAIDRAALRGSLAGGMVVTAAAGAISALAALVAGLFVAIPFPEIWVALAPGGFEAMVVMGLALGYDPAFVLTHHAMRLFVLAAALPAMTALMRRRPTPAGRR